MIEYLRDKSQSMYATLFIALGFLLTGCAYLTWMYRLSSHYDSLHVTLFTEIMGYAFQALGLIFFVLFFRKTKRYALLFSLIMICAITAAIFYINSPIDLLMSGFVLNLCIGVVAAYYLFSLSGNESKSYAGVIFGLGYAIGTVGTYLISIIGRSNPLQNINIALCYVIFSIAIYLLSLKISLFDDAIKAPSLKSTPVLTAICVFMISLVKGLGFYFPTADVTSGSVSLELTRLFYAIGLVIAGFIIDGNRRNGSILCMIALVCPFLLYSLSSNDVTAAALWCLGYLFSGFFIIYRTIVFVEASVLKQLPILVCYSLIFGRLGDASGSLIGMLLNPYASVLMIIALIAFTIAILLLIKLEDEQYNAQNTDIPLKYDFTSREHEVYDLAIDGLSNKEIASRLFITENTVKYHIKNILKKTGCKNRIELQRASKKATG